MRDKLMATRVSPEAYKKLLQKCADAGCSTYEYLRTLVLEDVGLAKDLDGEETVSEPAENDFQRKIPELIVENERSVEGRVIIHS